MFTFGLRAPGGEVIYDQLEVELVDCLEAKIEDEALEVEIVDELVVELNDEILVVEVCE